MKNQILIRGKGRAGQAAVYALNVLKESHPQLNIGEVTFLKRDESLKGAVKDPARTVLVLSNPPGLHREGLIDAAELGLGLVVCEKPVCVTFDEINALRALKIKAAVLHVYRQTWGVQTLKKMIDSKEVGELITIEGRYWQSSAAKRALQPETTGNNWKNNVKLSGHSDTLLDVGCHWSDTAIFLGGRQPTNAHLWLSHANAETPHRDTHVQLALEFGPELRAMSSISKTVHGASNHFEVNVIGTKRSLTWNFLNPDQILVGRGGQVETLVRGETVYGSQFPPFHAMGWLEGYIEIIKQGLADMQGQAFEKYPTLPEGLANIEMLLKAKERAAKSAF